MTQEPYWCPVDGCDFGRSESRSLASVRSHLNADASEGHDWDARKQEVANQEQQEPDEEQAEGDETSSSEAGETSENSPPPTATDANRDGEQQEQAEEQAEGDETAASEAPETGAEEGDMATQEEYEQQYQNDSSDSSRNDGGSDSIGDKDDSSDDGAGFSVPKIGGTTLLAVAGVLLVAFIAWRVLGDSGEIDHEPPEEQADGDEDGGGQMVDIEDGTGGVMT